jgi:hypothetical protein
MSEERRMPAKLKLLRELKCFVKGANAKELSAWLQQMHDFEDYLKLIEETPEVFSYAKLK